MSCSFPSNNEYTVLTGSSSDFSMKKSIFDGDPLSTVKKKVHEQIKAIAKIDPAKATALSHRVCCSQWTSHEISALRALGLDIDEGFRPLGLSGGMFGAEAIIIPILIKLPAILKFISEAMSNGKGLFASKQGASHATAVRCKLKVNNEKVKGIYTGEMAKLKKGFFKDLLKEHWVPFGEGKIILTNGDYYDGRWKDGLFWNTGSYETSDGSFRYEGHWEAGQRTGYGKFYESNAGGQRMMRYEGGWKDGLFHGNGTYFNDDGTTKIGTWEAGELKTKIQSQDQRENIVANLGTFKIEEVFPEFAAIKVDAAINSNILKTQGLERNSWMADALIVAGLKDAEGLPIENKAPLFQVISNDTRKCLPFISATKLQTIDLSDVTLPIKVAEQIEHQNALDWLKSFASKFEKLKPQDPSFLKPLETLQVKRVVLGVGVPINPAKTDRGEFSPRIVRNGSCKGESWGYLAWTNNGIQFAFGTDNGPAGSLFKLMTEGIENGSPIMRGWAIQSIDASHIASIQAATIRTAIEKNLANAIHIVAFRFAEENIPWSGHQNDPGVGTAPEMGTMVAGEHKEDDKRGVYKAAVYRRFDPNSVVMATLIASPINLRKGQLSENEVKLSIQSHQTILKELVHNAQANNSI